MPNREDNATVKSLNIAAHVGVWAAVLLLDLLCHYTRHCVCAVVVVVVQGRERGRGQNPDRQTDEEPVKIIHPQMGL